MTNTTGGKSFTPFTLIRALKRRWLWLALPVALLVPAAALYTSHMPRRFRARTLVGEATAQTHLRFGDRNDAAAATNAQDQLRTVREVLLSQPVLESIIREFRLYPVPASGPSQQSLDDTKAAIQIQVETPDTFYIGFEGAEAQQTMAVANRLGNLFIERTTAVHDNRVQQEDTFLDTEVARMRAQLEAQDNSLKSYRQNAAQELPERLASNLKQLETLQEQVQSRNDQITAAEASRSAAMEELSALEKQGVLDAPPPEKTPQQIAIEDARRKLAQLKGRYTPEYPEVVRAEKELHDLEAQPRQPAPAVHQTPSQVQMRYFALQAELKSLAPRIESYKRERDALMAEERNYESVVNSSPGYETGLAEKTRDAAVTRANYETLVAKQQDAKLNHRAEKIDAVAAYKILEPAQLPTAPSSPHRARILLAALAGSLILGFMGAFIVERMDTTFETSEDFESVMGMPVLSTIPSISASGSDSKGGLRLVPGAGAKGITAERKSLFQKHRVTVLGDPHSIAAQQYGILALKVQKWMARAGGTVVAVTSSTGAEGKSLTALNLSASLAASLAGGLDGGVLLIDCDLRLPQVDQRLGLDGEHGLGDLLEDPKLEPAAYISTVGNLDVLAAGLQTGGALLPASRMRDLLARLRKNYRLIVLDCPPVVPIADSHAISELADGVVMVVRARATRPELFRRATASLDAKNLLGVVLNDVEYEATPYAYAYKYYQRHYLGRS
jgi:polysaccharide chain length determinant protein (PEP-CTERM system associated)